MSQWAARFAVVVATTVLVGGYGFGAPGAAGSPSPSINSPTIPTAPAPGMDRYVDPVNGWSISYPVGWRVDGSDPAFVQIHDPQNQALVGVHVWLTDSPLNAVVDHMVAAEEQNHRQSGLTYVLKGRQLIVLPNGTSAVDVRAEIEPGGRTHQIFVVKGGKAFNVNAETYVASWDSFSADFDRILLSFAPPA